MSINWLVLSSQWSIKDNCRSGCSMTRIWRDLGLINLRTEFFINYKATVAGFLRQPPPSSRLKRRPQITMNTHRDLITRLFVPDDKMDWWSAIKMVSSHQTRFLLSTWLVAKTETSGRAAAVSQHYHYLMKCCLELFFVFRDFTFMMYHQHWGCKILIQISIVAVLVLIQHSNPAHLWAGFRLLTGAATP